LPFPWDLDDGGLRTVLGDIPWTPVTAAIQSDLAQFRQLVEQNLIDLNQLNA
jgi:hypothetical protein